MLVKSISTVPTAEVLVDTCLSKTNRKTPTEIHRHFQISRIREFYTKKIKFTSAMYTGKLREIVESFPKVDEIHPFTADLINVLYDKDHYKMALGHVKTILSAIANTEKEYVKLVKYGDSLYRCKQLKRAALGKMSTMAKKLKATLAYLEEVRQSLMRMPDIDPSTRTLLICGYPNVGKSSFINTVSRAKVDVQPYAFTTRNLYVGHFDYKYLRWQIIDTPGILDQPIEDMNTIEMQSITALAHLRACVLYFIDVSESCGYSVEAQVGLYRSLKPLFEGKPTVFILSKSDVKKAEALDAERKQELHSITSGFPTVEISSVEEVNIDLAKNTACEELLTHRVELKLQEKRMEEFRKMLDIRHPSAVDPEAHRVAQTEEFGQREHTQMELAEQARERGEKYFADLNKGYFVKEEWKYDAIPEIINGKNVSDFVDRDIEEKVLRLEQEEEYFLEKIYGKKYNLLSPEELEIKEKVFLARKARIYRVHSEKRSTLPARHKIGAACRKGSMQNRKEQEMDIVSDAPAEACGKSRAAETRVAKLTPEQRRLVERRSRHVKEKVLKGRSESDRTHLNARPMHLFSGKRGIGKNQRR